MTSEEAKTLLGEVVKSDYEPNEWETNFIDSILDSIDRYHLNFVSDKQANCIKKLYEKATSADYGPDEYDEQY